MKKLLLSTILLLSLFTSQAVAGELKTKIEFTYYSPVDKSYYAITSKDLKGCRWVLNTNRKDYKGLVNKKVLITYSEYKKFKGEYYIKGWKVVK